jgi:hypothetical protein
LGLHPDPTGLKSFGSTALDFHIVQDIQKEMEKDAAKGGEKKTPFIDRWIKSMLLARESDG